MFRGCRLVGTTLCKEFVVCFELGRGVVSLTVYIAQEGEITAKECHSTGGSGRGPWT